MPSAQRLVARVSRSSKRASKKRVKNPKNKKKKGGKIIMMFIFLVFCLGFLFASWKLYLSWINRHWISGARMTVVIAKDNPKIYSYNPQNRKMTIIEVPANTQLESASGYGTWLAGGLWGLGNQEGMAGELLKNSLQKSLGIPIDGWIEVEGENLFERNPLGFFEAAVEAIAVRKIKTNLTFFDRLGLLSKAVGTGSGDKKQIDLIQSGVVKREKLSDGTQGYVIVPEKARVVFSEMADDLVYKEAKRVVIVNTTNKSGLAATVAQTVTILGARVINTKNTTDEKIDFCAIRGRGESINSLTGKRLIQIFGCTIEQVNGKGAEDLEIILGSKFAEKY